MPESQGFRRFPPTACSAVAQPRECGAAGRAPHRRARTSRSRIGMAQQDRGQDAAPLRRSTCIGRRWHAERRRRGRAGRPRRRPAPRPAKKRSSSARRYSLGERPVGNAPRGRLQPRAECGTLLRRRLAAGLAQQIVQRLGQRTAPRPAPRAMPSAPCRRTRRVRVLAGRQRREPQRAVRRQQRQRQFGGPRGRTAARRHRRRSTASAPATSRHSSSSCSSVSAVPSGATAPPKPA